MIVIVCQCFKINSQLQFVHVWMLLQISENMTSVPVLSAKFLMSHELIHSYA